MLRLPNSTIALVAVLATPLTQLQAQELGTTITLTVGPSLVDFGDFGGRFGAAVIRLSVSRDFNRLTGVETSLFALAPLGGMAAIAGCVTGGVCQTRSTPSVLSGAMASLFVYAGESGLRMAVGGGAVSAHGGEGFARRSTVAALVGLDLIPRSNNRFVPTLSVRLLQLSSPLAGARQLFLPGLGLRF